MNELLQVSRAQGNVGRRQGCARLQLRNRWAVHPGAKGIWIIVMCLLLLPSCSHSAIERVPDGPRYGAETTVRVLFVGNSFTFWRGGLWKHLNSLSAVSNKVPRYKAEPVVRGGASLEVMWKKTRAREVIAEKRWDVVVLQGDIPETTVASFREYSDKFVKAVRDVGARPILFMAWDYDRLDWIDMKAIIAAHRAAEKSLSVEVAPVGFAWQQMAQKDSDLNMYSRDREHPSAAGMYLSFVTIEGLISGDDPRTRPAKGLGIKGLSKLSDSEVSQLRETASESLRLWTQKNHEGESDPLEADELNSVSEVQAGSLNGR